jgi:carboxymethylenebutenolidase
MTQIVFRRPDGKDCPAYLAEPAVGRSNGKGVVVAQDMWGIAPGICRFADAFAEAGYRVVTPDFFRGRRAKDLAEGFANMGALDFSDATSQDVAGAAIWLKESCSKIAVAGPCMGGAIALLAAAYVPTFDAGVCFYGIPPREALDPATIRVPLSCHFATRDNWCTPEKVNELEERLRAGNVPYELFRYEADHAFHKHDDAAHDPAALRLAYTRVFAFLERTLG